MPAKDIMVNPASARAGASADRCAHRQPRIGHDRPATGDGRLQLAEHHWAAASAPVTAANIEARLVAPGADIADREDREIGYQADALAELLRRRMRTMTAASSRMPAIARSGAVKGAGLLAHQPDQMGTISPPGAARNVDRHRAHREGRGREHTGRQCPECPLRGAQRGTGHQQRR